MLLFTVLWLGFAAFWEITAVSAWRNDDGPFLFVLLDGGFFLLGLNGMVGAQVWALRRLRPAIEAAVAAALTTPPDGWHAFAPGAELLAMRHERGLARSFAT